LAKVSVAEAYKVSPAVYEVRPVPPYPVATVTPCQVMEAMTPATVMEPVTAPALDWISKALAVWLAMALRTRLVASTAVGWMTFRVAVAGSRMTQPPNTEEGGMLESAESPFAISAWIFIMVAATLVRSPLTFPRNTDSGSLSRKFEGEKKCFCVAVAAVMLLAGF
jgi:hypothetical protein